MKGFLVCLMIGLIGSKVDAATTSIPIGDSSQRLDESSTRATTTTTEVFETSESPSSTIASQAQQTKTQYSSSPRSPHSLTSTSQDTLTTVVVSNSSQAVTTTSEQNIGPVTIPTDNGKSTPNSSQSGPIKDHTKDPDSAQTSTPSSEVSEIMDTTTASSGTAGYEFGTTPSMLLPTDNTNMHNTTRIPDIRSTTPLTNNQPSKLETAKSNKTTIIAVVVVVVILALGATGGAVWFYRTKYRKGGSSLYEIPMSG